MPKQATPFICPHCGADAKVLRSEVLLSDVTVRERQCDGPDKHRFKTRVMEEVVMRNGGLADFIHELAFESATRQREVAV